ncbi:hypothetical protein CASFOL_005493 [Castilleja foliolosa]|uniref:RING-type domain-containing protein n=1 Tax=Castilleja foliolosa TaxID=1961234 RepID=A0ABD3E7J9_9LAMI
MDEEKVTGSSKKAGPQPSPINIKKTIHFEKYYRRRLTKGDIKDKVTAWESMSMDKSLKAQLGSVSASGLGLSSVVINERNDNQSVQDPVFALPAGNNSTSTAQEIELKDLIDYCERDPFDSTLQIYMAMEEKDRSPLIFDAEVEKLRREKQSYDESNVKQLNEMVHALGNVNEQIEQWKCTIHRLEFENSVVMKEMEKAKTEACRSAVKLQEEMMKEHDLVKKAQACEAEKDLVQKRLTSLRRKNVEGEKQLGKAKNRLNQFKWALALLKKEEKEKLNAEKRYVSLRAKIEAEDALMQVEADNIIQTGQMNKQKREDDIKNLETMISELKLESDKIKIATLNAGYGLNLKKQVPKVRKRLAVFQDIVKGEYVELESVCIMCTKEETSVVFIPCSHQVLCGPCNVLHEKQGMNDCPSCRSTIDKRVVATYRPN